MDMWGERVNVRTIQYLLVSNIFIIYLLVIIIIIIYII